MRVALSPPHARRKRRPLPFVLAGAAVLLVAAFFVARAGFLRPSISAIDPAIGEPGATLRILGSNFGDERGDSMVEFDGSAPTSSSYLSWSDEAIELRVPHYAESSLVRVVTGAGRSNAKMFMSKALLPSSPSGLGSMALGPVIGTLSSDSGVIGSALVITGLGFGANRGSSEVLFSWVGESGYQAQDDASGRGYVSPSDAAGEYEAWSDKEIRVRVPDGAVSGGMAVRTAQGTSALRYFQVAEGPGQKSFRGRKTYALSTFVTISRVKTAGANLLYLWMPFPVDAASQRGVKALERSHEPFINDYRGLSVYRLSDIESDKLITVTQDSLVQVFGIETDVKADKIIAPPSPKPPLYAAFTAPDALVPADAPAVAALARKAVAREKNPYRLARAVYDALAAAVAYDAGAKADAAVDAFAKGKADSWDLSLLYAAALRAAGVPALPVAGVVVDDSRRAWRHAWVEFYVYGFGWLPVDPVLLGGGSVGAFKPPFEDRAKYFGNMDDRHIAFSRGVSKVDPITPDGRTVAASRRYSFQSVFEEASGGLSAYTSFWSDVEVTGVY